MKNLTVVVLTCMAAAVAAAVEKNPTWGRISRTMERLERSTEANPETVRVLFYGQSIVAQGWGRKHLIPELKKRYPTVNFVDECRAIGGYQSPTLIKTAEADLYPFYPDILFFHVYGPMDKYEEIIRRVRTRTTADIVLWTSHLNRNEGGSVKKIRELLEHPDERSLEIRRVADKYGCMFIDMRTKWCKMLLEKNILSGVLLADTVHMKKATLPTYAEMLWEDILAGGTPEANPAAGQVTTAPGALRLEFVGNRVTAVGDGQAGAVYDVFLDGRRTTEWAEMWTMTRASKAPGKNSWNPAINRIDLGPAAPCREDWTLTLLAGGKEDGTAVPFTLKGSKTGEDGTGWSTNRFVSTSGRVVIEPSYWMSKFWWGYRKVKPEAGFEIRWRCVPMVEETYAPGAKGTTAVLVQNCPNGKHVLELRPKKEGPLGIASFTVYAPKAE